MRAIALVLSLALIFVIPWEGVIRIPGLGTAAKALGLAVGVFWLATIIITGRFRRPGPFHIVVALFVLWNAVSIFWSADINQSVARVATWVQLFVLVLVLWDLYTTRAALFAGLQAYVLGAYVAVASALANYFAGDPYYSFYQRFSPAETTNPDGFGFIVALGIPLAWYLASSKTMTGMSQPLRLINFAYIPVAFLGIALSGTRTALIAAIPATAFGLASLTRLRPWARITTLLLISSAILILLPEIRPLRSFQRLGTTYAEITEGDLNNRINNWREGLATFSEHPILGVGSSMYRSVNSLGKVAHNSFLSVLVELGLIGFILFGAVLTIAFIQARAQPNWDSKFWFTTLMVWAIGSSTLSWEYRKTTWLFLGLLIASAALNSRREQAMQRSQSIGPEAQALTHTKPESLPPGEAEKSYAA
jgi:O-antigen ligase